MIITLNGTDYIADQYGSVYEMTGSSWVHVGKLFNETLVQWMGRNLPSVGTETDSELYG